MLGDEVREHRLATVALKDRAVSGRPRHTSAAPQGRVAPPWPKSWSRSYSPNLKLIFHESRAVRGGHALRANLGLDAPTQPRYRETLIDMAGCLNAAQRPSPAPAGRGCGYPDSMCLRGLRRHHYQSAAIHPDEDWLPESRSRHLAVSPQTRTIRGTRLPTGHHPPTSLPPRLLPGNVCPLAGRRGGYVPSPRFRSGDLPASARTSSGLGPAPD